MAVILCSFNKLDACPSLARQASIDDYQRPRSFLPKSKALRHELLITNIFALHLFARCILSYFPVILTCTVVSMIGWLLGENKRGREGKNANQNGKKT